MSRRPFAFKFIAVVIAFGAITVSACRPPVTMPGRGTPPGPKGASSKPTKTIPPSPPARVGASAPSVAADEMLLGNPDNAAENPSNRDHYLLRHDGFTASYNDTLRFPNWVSWRLSAADIGTVERGQFKPDSALPDGITRVTTSAYTGTGFDRGHNCPSKDRTRTRADNDGVFVMSNITPQTHAMNAGPWENLETYCRTLAQQGNELYIVCGHGFDNGMNGNHRTVGPASIAVPDWGWKVVVVVPESTGDDRKRIAAGTRIIAVRMPNKDGIESIPWPRYVTTPGEIEHATGLHFFTGLSASVASTLRQTRDASGTQAATPATNTTPPQNERTNGTSATSGTASDIRVWVNTKSGAYWKPGSRYYGKTKEGKFMRESAAQQAGYHPAEP